jgi:hypothetical protein
MDAKGAMWRELCKNNNMDAKGGMLKDAQFNSMWEQSELVSLTWVYCICHYSSGAGRWLVGCLLSLASAKLLNASNEIQTRSQPAVNNGP